MPQRPRRPAPQLPPDGIPVARLAEPEGPAGAARPRRPAPWRAAPAGPVPVARQLDAGGDLARRSTMWAVIGGATGPLVVVVSLGAVQAFARESGADTFLSVTMWVLCGLCGTAMGISWGQKARRLGREAQEEIRASWDPRAAPPFGYYAGWAAIAVNALVIVGGAFLLLLALSFPRVC